MATNITDVWQLISQCLLGNNSIKLLRHIPRICKASSELLKTDSFYRVLFVSAFTNRWDNVGASPDFDLDYTPITTHNFHDDAALAKVTAKVFLKYLPTAASGKTWKQALAERLQYESDLAAAPNYEDKEKGGVWKELHGQEEERTTPKFTVPSNDVKPWTGLSSKCHHIKFTPHDSILLLKANTWDWGDTEFTSAFMELTSPSEEMLAADMHHEIYIYRPHKYYRYVATVRLNGREDFLDSGTIEDKADPLRHLLEDGEDTMFVASGARFGAESNYAREVTIWGKELIDLLATKYRPELLKTVKTNTADKSATSFFVKAVNVEWMVSE